MVFVTLAKLAPGKGKEFIESLREGIIDQSNVPPEVKILSAYITYGQYDLVLTCSAPDLKTANAALKRLLTSGLVSTETLVGQTVEEFIS